MNLLFTDFETSGLDPDVHEILDAGLILCDIDTMEILEQVSVKVKPEHLEISPDKTALAINGYNEAEWAEAGTLDEALELIQPITANAVFIAQNVYFDYMFYRAALKKTGRKNLLHYHRLDVGSMAFPLIQPYQMSLDKLCLILGIQPEPAPHRAINGAMREYNVVCKLRDMAKKGESFITEPQKFNSNY